MWTLKALLAALAAQGYKAEKPDAASVKAFLAENKHITLKGNPDVDALFKGETKSVELDPGDENDAKPGKVNLTLTSDEAEIVKKALRGDQSARGKGFERVGHMVEGDDTDRPHRFAIGNSQRKAYDARVKAYGIGHGQYQAKYADADTAEICTAIVRLGMAGTMEYGQKANDLAIVQKAYVESSNTLGGYLVPTEFVSHLIYLTEPYGTARKIANVVKMSREVQQHPRKTGIPTMGWASETQTATTQNNGFDLVELVAKKLMLLMTASNELLEDSAISVADDVASTVREAYDKACDSAYFLGDGSSTYGGFMGLANALPAGAYFNGSGAWSAFTTGDFNLALGRLENVNMARVGIVCSRQAYHQVCMRLEKATSQFKPLIEGPKADGSFLGFPVYFSQLLPTATGSGNKSFYIGDFVGASMIGERRDLNVMQSDHAAFTSDSIQWRATARASIAVHGDGKGTTYGPIVCLKATA